MKKVFMEITQDELALPIHVTDTVIEMSEITGVRSNTIRSSICYGKVNKHPRFIKVYIEEEEEA